MAPPALPVSLSEVKDHCNELSSDHDSKLIGLIYAAIGAVEHYLQRSIITQTWKMQFDCFHECFYLLKGPAQSVTSITYVDSSGQSQTLSSDKYVLDTASDPARVYLSYGEVYPSTRSIKNAVAITYIAGYGLKGHNVPEPIRHAIKMIVADLFNNPESSIMDISRTENPALQMMLQPYKVYGFTTHD